MNSVYGPWSIVHSKVKDLKSLAMDHGLLTMDAFRS